MQILILLKANIRHKKGAFTSIVILMILISMSLTAIVSVRDNCTKSMENAYSHVDAANITLTIKNKNLTQDLMDSVKNDSRVERVHDYQTIGSSKAEINGRTNGSSWFLLKYRMEYRLMNSTLTGYEKEAAALKKGEIYITQGIMTDMQCSVSDTVKLWILGQEHEFVIKGIVEEPVMGASVIGWKQVFISDEDFDSLYQEIKQNETEEWSADIRILQIYKAETCQLSDGQFKRQLNLDTGVVDNAMGSMTREMAMHYTGLFMEIIGSILMVFIVLLLIIVMIIIGYSISTGIQMDYVNLGILKAQGFTQGQIRGIFVLQYLFAEAVGTILGIVFAVPLIRSLGNVFQPIMAIVTEKNISLGKSLLVLCVVFVISGVFIFVITGKVGTIAPVRAIAGGRSEIYFDSRVKLPITKKGLTASLALRQFLSASRRYISAMAIVAILVFFMITIMILGNVVNSESIMESMGEIITDVDVNFKEVPHDAVLEEIERTVETYSSIEKKYYMNTTYFSIEGEEIYCFIYKNPEQVSTVKGRAPLYDNEIVITEIVAEELNIKMGDTVTVAHNDKKAEYIVSGIYQSVNDTGLNFAIGQSGAKKLGIGGTGFGGYQLTAPEKAGEITEALNAQYADILEAKQVEEDSMEETYTIAIRAMQVIIDTFSILFALVVVIMFCTKAFLQEKTDIGIYKALGFTSNQLRVSFAVRFFIIALLGTVPGTVFSVLFSGKLLNVVLRPMGITNLLVHYTPFTIIVPVLLICGCFFLFALLASGKMKRVAVRELVAE